MTKEEKVKEAINEIRPRLQMDGGDVEFIGLDDDVVKVRLQGACAGCPGATMTLKMGIERYIKEKIPEIKEVVNV
jgi:Fe-S cluster biogenesis protein NfuA